MGFFPYNYHPAIIYLGDTGALFIGFMIGVLSLQGLKNATAVAILSPVIILGVPIVDTVVAIVRRKLSGRPAMEADKMHLHHRLLAMGFTHRGAVLVVLCHRYPLFIDCPLVKRFQSSRWYSLTLEFDFGNGNSD